MIVRQARKTDLPEIQALQGIYGKMTVEEHHLSKRDIALVAVDSGRVVGFTWAGLMAKNKIAYVDLVAVLPEYSGRGVSSALYKALGRRLVKNGVKEVFGFIRRDEYHDKSAVNALKFALMTDGFPYTYVRADVNFAISEIDLEA